MLLVGESKLERSHFINVEAESEVAAKENRELATLSGLTLDQVEKHMIERAMEAHQGNLSRVAKALGLSRFALYRRRGGVAAQSHVAFGVCPPIS
ncbi:MAG: helix-turn-helix domain-containing protein [Burkholderiales bacterium]|nr:helix-turn-helix domain-containing protein [Burkholderiales bacterium]